MSNVDIHKVVDYHSQVETMQEALAFVMRFMDRVGADPEIMISPVFCDCENDCERQFFVSVRGRVEVSMDE